jgi:hypothetical protein
MVKKSKKRKLTKFKSITSLSIFPERSPQLQENNPSILNRFTTKNVSTEDKHGQPWNTVENNKLAYKRSARGAQVGSYPKVIYGNKVERLTNKNYKNLKNGDLLYYDRGSVVFRGPFTYLKTLRGPVLLLTARDIGYGSNVYKFIIPVSKLKTEILYVETKRKMRPRKRTIKRTKKKRAKKHMKKRSKTIKRRKSKN